MPNLTTNLLILAVILIVLPTETYAFGAGDIPDFAYLNDKAFRHGDIENILTNLVKAVGHSGGSSSLFGFAKSIINQASGGAKFSKSDVKKVYFGNWLRDYSQAMDIAGLSKLTAETLVLVVSVLGFMTFGFATEEFEVTADRLGVYLPTEHIDNPKGYAEKEGDARQFHPKLRPPVDPRELEIDSRTGMKKYIATEDQGWDSSTALIRRTFRACIDIGRRARGQEGPELWEAYRLLGTGLHTMEDLLAHSNWCEIALRKMGHEEVFCHVGDNVTVRTPNGTAPPLVTGTFGSADFLHSLMGEATDKLSQASVTDLSQKMNDASQGGSNSTIDTLKSLLSKLPIGGGSSDEKMSEAEDLHAESKAYNFDPDDVAPPEIQAKMLELLKWRDGVYRDILEKIEMIPGLSDLLDNLTNALNAYVYTVLAPWLTPILQQATGVLGEGSKAVIDSEDQYTVFDDPDASDPSHSLLSKDHFGLILNEPAGKIAQLVVENTVNLIVPTWFDDSVNPDQMIDQILEAFHHPYYATGTSGIQAEMFELMEKWIRGLGDEEAQETLQALTKESVRAGKNKRLGSDDDSGVEAGYGGCGHGSFAPSYGARPKVSNSAYDEQQNESQNQYGGARQTQTSSYGQDDSESYGGGYNSQQRTQQSQSYGRSHAESRDDNYGGRESQPEEEYSSRSQRNDGYGESRREGGYNSRREDEEERPSYSSSRNEPEPQSDYSGGYQPSYEQPQERVRSSGYGSYEEPEAPRTDYGHGRRGDGERSYEAPARQDDFSSEERHHGSRRGEEEFGYSRPEERSYEAPAEDNSRFQGHRGQSRGEEEYGSSDGYGRGREDRGYEPPREERPSYGDETESYGERTSGYNPGYVEGGNRGFGFSDGGEERSFGHGGHSYQDRDSEETFGAERLNINDEDNGGYGRRRNDYEERNEY